MGSSCCLKLDLNIYAIAAVSGTQAFAEATVCSFNTFLTSNLCTAVNQL